MMLSFAWKAYKMRDINTFLMGDKIEYWKENTSDNNGNFCGNSTGGLFSAFGLL